MIARSAKYSDKFCLYTLICCIGHKVMTYKIESLAELKLETGFRVIREYF